MIPTLWLMRCDSCFSLDTLPSIRCSSYVVVQTSVCMNAHHKVNSESMKQILNIYMVHSSGGRSAFHPTCRLSFSCPWSAIKRVNRERVD